MVRVKFRGFYRQLYSIAWKKREGEKKGQRGIKPEMTHTRDFEDSGREGMYIPSAEFELRGWINGCRVS